jgi:hypothetical protein
MFVKLRTKEITGQPDAMKVPALPGLKEDAMLSTFHRLAASASAIALVLVLAAPPAHASEAAGAPGTLRAQLVSWFTAWWPWSAAESGGLHAAGGRRGSLPIARSPWTGERTGLGRRPQKPVIRIECNPTPDPNGCPH